MTRESRKEANSDARQERVPLGIKRSKLAVKDKDDGYVYRWLNDEGGRISDAERGGYEFVTSAVVGEGDIANREQSLGDRVSRIVGKGERGNPITAYLMRIKREWYEEDQKAKMKPIEETDAQIRRGMVKPVEGGYVPTTGINMHSTTE